MGTARKFTKVGNSYAVIIPRQIMAVVGIEPDTRYEIATDGHDLIIRPMSRRRDDHKRRVAKAIDQVFTRYRRTMMRLAGK